MKDTETVDVLAKQASRISEHQEQARKSKSEGALASLRAALNTMWSELDYVVEDAYNLTSSQRSVIHRYPRRVDKFDLLLRQVAPPEEDED